VGIPRGPNHGLDADFPEVQLLDDRLREAIAQLRHLLLGRVHPVGPNVAVDHLPHLALERVRFRKALVHVGSEGDRLARRAAQPTQ
jgi:hypothetical protein